DDVRRRLRSAKAGGGSTRNRAAAGARAGGAVRRGAAGGVRAVGDGPPSRGRELPYGPRGRGRRRGPAPRPPSEETVRPAGTAATDGDPRRSGRQAGGHGRGAEPPGPGDDELPHEDGRARRRRWGLGEGGRFLRRGPGADRAPAARGRDREGPGEGES